MKKVVEIIALESACTLAEFEYTRSLLRGNDKP